MTLTPQILEINKQKIIHSFPSTLKQEVEVVVDFLWDKNFDIHPTVEQAVVLNGESLIIPGRLYFIIPTETMGNDLTELQQTILRCLYLRHSNGFVRQQQLEKLIGKTDYFITPFVFQLLGEYVIEILDIIHLQITEKTLPNYIRFITENPKYWQQTESRMASYWNEYYRISHKKLTQHMGRKIINRIKQELTHGKK